MDACTHRVLYDFLRNIPAHRRYGPDAPPQSAAPVDGYKNSRPCLKHFFRHFFLRSAKRNHSSLAHIILQRPAGKRHISILFHPPFFTGFLPAAFICFQEAAPIVIPGHPERANPITHPKGALIGQTPGHDCLSIHGSRHHGKAAVAAFPRLFAETF